MRTLEICHRATVDGQRVAVAVSPASPSVGRTERRIGAADGCQVNVDTSRLSDRRCLTDATLASVGPGDLPGQPQPCNGGKRGAASGSIMPSSISSFLVNSASDRLAWRRYSCRISLPCFLSSGSFRSFVAA